jgi:hypothetical protein
LPRISLWKDGKHSNDFKFIDRRVSEMFTVGGVTSHIYAYIGPESANITGDPTQPNYTGNSVTNIQDLLFLENRDRNYDTDVYRLRCIYNIQDVDFDLSQFGLMLSNGTLFITYHTIDMVQTIGRKLMSGDVIELPNLKEFYALDSTVPVALKRFYVVQEGIYSAEGYSPTWWSHLWRVKCTPLVDSEEYSQIIDTVVTDPDTGDPIIGPDGNVITTGNISTTANAYQAINDAIVQEAENIVPFSGYDTEPLWAPLFAKGTRESTPWAPGSSPNQKFTGYLVADGTPIDGYPYTTANSFPISPSVGEYVLRADFIPPRLYRCNGNSWIAVSDVQRARLTPGTGNTERDFFINNSNVQPLSNLFGNSFNQ